jgi:putative transposase
MPRRPRLHVPGLPLHVVQRGHNRDACFFCEEDYLAYRQWLGEALVKTGCQLHAYVLMTNHVHLLLTPPDAQAVSQLVISLGRRSVQYVNRTYRRTGTLWDSRYKSSLVHAEDYLLLCQRYIELNPVRAGMVATPSAYPWSSHRHYAAGEANALLSAHPTFLALSPHADRRRELYAALVASGIDASELETVRVHLRQGRPLGSAQFQRQVEALLGRRTQVRPRGRPSHRE